MRGPTVADVMNRPVVTVDAETAFKDIVGVLAEHRISAVAVVDSQQHPLGVVSEADLLNKRDGRATANAPSLLTYLRHSRRWNKARGSTARQVMTSHMRTVHRDEPLAAAARTLAEGKLRRLFVTDGSGRLVGVLARRDVLGVFLRPDEEIKRAVEREVLRRAMWVDPATVNVRVRDGVVSLSGLLDRRSDADIAAELTAALPGVVDVRNELRVAFEDTSSVRKTF